MITQYPKGSPAPLSTHFKSTEFDCGCPFEECTSTWISTDLIASLEELRLAMKEPILINSGFRCVPWNKRVGGSEKSYHCVGLAADIRCKYKTIMEIEQAAKRVLGFSNGGIGIYPAWIHLDARGFPARWKA